jgi:hypothetical protein
MLNKVEIFMKNQKNYLSYPNPSFLHYVFEKLANILVLHTFRDVKIPYSHGLTYYGRKDAPIGDEPITITKKGLFQCLHDCYSIDPSVYTQAEKPNFTLMM